MKFKSISTFCLVFCIGSAGALSWGARGSTTGQPPPSPDPVPATPIEGYYFWRLGHMDGPHEASYALGISRDGTVAVGSTDVVDFVRAFRIDIDWAIATGDGVAPLYNELQVQEGIGGEAAFAASDKTVQGDYSKVDPEHPGTIDHFDWCGSFPVGTLTTGTVSYAVEWLWAYDPEAAMPNYLGIPDFGGGISEMVANDVSADGTLIVGTGNTKTGPQAFLADLTVTDEAGLPVPLQLTIIDGFASEQTLQTSSAEAVSADGRLIAGYGGTKTGNKAFISAFLGTNGETGEAILEGRILSALDGGKWSEAYALTVTPEGVVYVAGRSDSPKGPQACVWFLGDDPATAEVEAVWLAKGIGGLSKRKYDSVATGIIYRPGSTAGDLLVVGHSKSILYPSEAFVWTGNPVLEPDGPYTLPDGAVNDYIGYLYDLEKILTKTGAGEASSMGSSWILNGACGVALSSVVNPGDHGPSARIVGWGTNPEGGVEAWLVTNFPYDELLFTHD